jgi:tetratricopeptide (TPR) repeat protein
LACCALYVFLSKVVFKKQKLLALIVCLLFVAHPLHTEVVANVKSRDEILSFLFMILTLYLVHSYASKQTLIKLVLSLLCFFCALLSKEYAVLLLVFVPMSLHLFSDKPIHIKNYIGLFSGMLILFGIYYFLRSGVAVSGAASIQDKELLNNPYLLATKSQALATKIFVLLKYLLLCLFPIKLSSDYGYNSIPYKSFGDISVWISIVMFISMIIGGAIALMKKNWIAFALAFYVLTLLLVTNLIFNVGATIGERLAFHASLGYCMILGAAILWLTKNKGSLAFVITLPILLLYSIKTVSRNSDWKNNTTLSLADVKTMPESALLNGNASLAYLDLSELPANKADEKILIKKAVEYGSKAVQIHPGMGSAYINVGLAYAKLDQFDSSLYMFNKAFVIYPNHPNKKGCYDFLADAIYRKGNSLGAQQKWAEGIALFNKAISLNPNNARYWYDLGGYYYNEKDLTKAKQAWLRAYQLAPGDVDIKKVQGVIK